MVSFADHAHVTHAVLNVGDYVCGLAQHDLTPPSGKGEDELARSGLQLEIS